MRIGVELDQGFCRSAPSEHGSCCAARYLTSRKTFPPMLAECFTTDVSTPVSPKVLFQTQTTRLSIPPRRHTGVLRRAWHNFFLRFEFSKYRRAIDLSHIRVPMVATLDARNDRPNVRHDGSGILRSRPEGQSQKLCSSRIRTPVRPPWCRCLTANTTRS